MEADWSVALAGDDPVITIPWAAPGDVCGLRFVDLRLGGHLIEEIEEARARPALRSALLLLNGPESSLWTAKCDAWTSSVEEGAEPIDPYEMDAEPGDATFGTGSYVDLVAREVAFLSSFDRQQRWIRMVWERLRAIPASAARVELVLRRAEVEGVPGFAVTWFVEGCGATAECAEKKWSEALTLALPVIMDAACGSTAANDTMTETGE